MSAVGWATRGDLAVDVAMRRAERVGSTGARSTGARSPQAVPTSDRTRDLDGSEPATGGLVSLVGTTRGPRKSRDTAQVQA